MKALVGVAALAATLALTACGGGNASCPQSMETLPFEAVAMSVPMPAPPPPPKPAPAPAPRPAAPKPAPAPAPVPKPAAPKPAVPKPTVPKPYVPPPPRPIYRPADPRMDRRSPSYNYRQVYVQHQTDHTPLLLMMAMSGAFSPSQPAHPECESK